MKPPLLIKSVSTVQTLTDSQMGTWTYTPDPMNRLSTGAATAGVYAGLGLTWGYDYFGNRQSQTVSGTFTGGLSQPAAVTFTTKNNNQVDQWAYDAAGDVVSDDVNMYAYDAEGHQTGVLNSLTGLNGYVYDAEGRRVELGVTGSTVAMAEQCTSLPFGDGLDCTGTDVNQLHFTGKERDTESNNDYFDARYYASNIAGRFLSPDTAGMQAVDLEYPQSLNRYAYVQNNPLSFIDPLGLRISE